MWKLILKWLISNDFENWNITGCHFALHIFVSVTGSATHFCRGYVVLPTEWAKIYPDYRYWLSAWALNLLYCFDNNIILERFCYEITAWCTITWVPHLFLHIYSLPVWARETYLNASVTRFHSCVLWQEFAFKSSLLLTLWSTPERLRGEVLTAWHYRNLRLPLPVVCTCVSSDYKLLVFIVSTEDEQYGGIPGISNRCLQFLGLLNCAYDACRRPNLPAVQVSHSSLSQSP